MKQKKVVTMSTIKFEGRDADKLALYLGKFLMDEEIIESNLEEIVYMKKTKIKKEKKIVLKVKNKKKVKGKLPKKNESTKPGKNVQFTL